MPVIITIMIAMFLILISWTWHNLGGIENIKKVVTIAICFLVIFGITFVVFNISKTDIAYDKEEGMQAVRIVLVVLFSLINGIIVMPFFSKILCKISEDDINMQSARKAFIFLLVMFSLFLVFESGYMKNVQEGIINIYNEALKNAN